MCLCSSYVAAKQRMVPELELSRAYVSDSAIFITDTTQRQAAPHVL